MTTWKTSDEHEQEDEYIPLSQEHVAGNHP